eukprot:gene2102-2462_t
MQKARRDDRGGLLFSEAAICASVQDLAQEQLGALVLRIVEEFGRRILFDDLALVHEDDAVGDLAGKAHFMGHAEHGHAFFGKTDHGVEHFLDHFRVERR